MIEYGQMNELTERWKLIQKVIKNNNLKTIVEIGTWKGMGSTLAILRSKNDDTYFFSVESNYQFYEIAKKNLSNYIKNFKLIYGRIVELVDVEEFCKNLKLTNEQKKWLEEDLKNFKNTKNVLSQIPKQIDFLLLDGGEFSTYTEWLVLKDRSNIIALDDIKTLKCKKIFEEIIDSKEFDLIEKTTEGNGFSIFHRKPKK